MKSFSTFISEARTEASIQAKKLGFTGDNHGGWYKNGEFVAKTVNGELKYFNKRQVTGRRDPNQTAKERKVPSSEWNDPEALQGQPQPQSQPQEQPPEKTQGILTLAFGRFNPPTIGHQKLMDVAADAAAQVKGDYLIFPSRSQDNNKNPLDPDTKIEFMQKLFPQHAERIINDPNIVTIFDALKLADQEGYSGVQIIAGSDRVKEFERLATNYNGQLYNFDTIEVISSGDRDTDTNGVSASRMRLAAAEGDYRKFREGLPDGYSRSDAMQLFDILRSSMDVRESNMWKISPKDYPKTLRESYINKEIFNIGETVQNLNTGLTGKIIRRGANHLICVTENEQMFKSWISDVSDIENKPTLLPKAPSKNSLNIATIKHIENIINNRRTKSKKI